jgi:hypothetical protein
LLVGVAEAHLTHAVKPLISLIKASPWPSHGMRYGTKGGSPGIGFLEDDIHHHDRAKIGMASSAQVVAAAGGENGFGGTIVCRLVKFIFAMMYLGNSNGRSTSCILVNHHNGLKLGGHSDALMKS